MIRNALDLLSTNESAAVIFTDGRNLDLDAPDGKTFTAWWVMAEWRTPDKVIIYRTHASDGHVDVYLADYVDKERRTTDRRFKIYLARVQHMGETDSPWLTFVKGKRGARSPVRYLSA